jgi:hypothetical protein
MSQSVGSTVKIVVSAPGKQTPALDGIPWFPGLTVLQAMVIGQAMAGPTGFSFRTVYHSQFGAYVDEIDDALEGGGDYWLLRLADPNGPLTDFGPAEQILAEPVQGSTLAVYWTLDAPPPPPNAGHLAKRVSSAG